MTAFVARARPERPNASGCAYPHLGQPAYAVAPVNELVDSKEMVAGFSIKNLVRIIAALGLLVSLTACGTPQFRTVVPANLVNAAVVPGLADKTIRIWGDQPPKDLGDQVKEIRDQRNRARASGISQKGIDDFLVLSGGGADGAFGAGLLNGWTKNGTRPNFGIVTGVSTGALIAPFAFLGPKYDATLKEIFTKHDTDDILQPKFIAGIIGGAAAVTSSAPIANLISKYITRSVLRKIALEHNRGRRLLIGTTNLDAQRSVIWDMGRIAAADSEEALRLFHKIILASVSIPGIFPPVLIDVTVKGKARQEMHVDGGTTDNVIFVPVQTNLLALSRQISPRPRHRLFIIVNSHTNPEWENVKPTTVEIAARSISTLIKQHTIGDLRKLYDFSKKNKIQYKLATIPSSFEQESDEPFDRKYMRALFKLGAELGAVGYRWRSKPPNE